MGYGDELMGSGVARGARVRGKRIAFGDGALIRHHQHAAQIYRGNPNVARPGDEGADDLEWVAHYPGRRLYCEGRGERWQFFPGHGNRPGEVFFSDDELEFAEKCGIDGLVLVEPSVPRFKGHAVNKQWPVERYAEVAHRLDKIGVGCAQFRAPSPYEGHKLKQVRHVRPLTFRHALAALARVALYVGPEGGLHHGAAAVGTPAVVLFGGFVSPAVTGYEAHANIFTGGTPCGSFHRCEHCLQAMSAITVQRVFDAAREKLSCQIVPMKDPPPTRETAPPP